MNFIELLKQDFTTRLELIQLPYYLTRTLQGYEKAGDIELEKFIVDSTQSFLDGSGELTKDSIGKLNLNNSLPLLIHIPITLSIRLWWICLRLKFTKSALIHEALGRTIPLLMDTEKIHSNTLHKKGETK